MLSVFLYSGALFGWAPLQQILLSEHDGRGQFDTLCQFKANTTNTEPCQSQLERLNLIYTLGTFTLSLVSLPGGWFLDTYGVRATVSLSGAFTVGGFVLFGISDSDSFDAFIPGAVLIATGGFLIMVSAFPVSFLFPKWQTIILAAVSCLFDASSLTFALFAPLMQYVSRKRLFLYYAGVAVVVYACLIFQWGLGSKESKHGADQDTEEHHNTGEDNEKPLVQNNGLIDEHLEREEEENNGLIDEHLEREEEEDKEATNMLNASSRMWDLTVFQQLQSFEYIFIVVFCSIQQLRANTYIGLNDEVLIRMGDTNGHYINIFSYALPCGIVFIPIIDVAVTRLGLVGALHATNLLGVLYGTLVLINSLPVQLGTFLAFTGYRAFLYSVMSTFNAHIFGLRTLGRITGFVFTSSAVFQLLQYPLVSSIDSVFHKNPFWPQVGLVSLSGVIIPFVFYFQCRKSRRRRNSGGIQSNSADVHSPLVTHVSPDGSNYRISSSESNMRKNMHRSSSFLRSPSKHTDRNDRLK